MGALVATRSKPRLITIPFSHYCEKARWALDHAEVPYVEEPHAPLAHAFAVKRAGGGRSVPFLAAGETLLGESTAIVELANEKARTGRGLYPDDPATRDGVVALVASFDRDLGPHIRRLIYFHLLPLRAATLAFFDLAPSRGERLLVHALFPLLRKLMQRSMRIDAMSAERSKGEVLRVFDAVEQRLADGRAYLTGECFSAADLTFAALASPGLLPDEHPIAKRMNVAVPDSIVSIVGELRGRPAGAFALRMYREHRYPLPSSAATLHPEGRRRP